MIALSLSIAFSRRSEPKASNLRTVGLEFTASRLTAGAMGKGLFVLFLVFSRWFWFPSSVPPCWQSSLPQGLALCCGACVLGDRADVPPMLFFFGGSLSDGLSWHAEIPRCCFVLYSLSCGAGLFLLPNGFSLPRISLHFLDTPQIYASVAERSHGSRQAGICWNGPLPS